MSVLVTTPAETQALADRVAALEARVAGLEEGVVPGPIPPPDGHPLSPEGTVIMPGKGTIDDGLGHAWIVTALGQVARDGATDTATSAVTRAGWYGGKVVQENAAGGTWASPPVWPTTWVTCPSPFPPAAATAASASGFIRNIGCNNHLGWSDTPHANVSVVQASMAYLGLTLMRDAVPWSDAVAEQYAVLSRAGIRWCMLVGPNNAEMTQTLPAELARVVSMGPAVVCIEGPNELNGQTVLFHGASSSDPNVGRQVQQYVANSVRALASLAGKPILNVSITIGQGGWEGYVAGLGDLSASCDIGNWHTYFSQGDQPSRNVSANRKYAEQSAPGRPVAYTECGYFTAWQDASGWGGVDEATQAKNTLNLLASCARFGIVQTYIYELLDSKPNPGLTDIEARFGLFYSDGRPKPVAMAIRNLTTILADTGATKAPPLSYQLTGMPSAGNSLLLAKSTGIYELLIWNEAPNWDGGAKRPIVVPAVNVTLTLPKPVASAVVFDPVNGPAPVQATNAPTATVRLPLADRLQVVELRP